MLAIYVAGNCIKPKTNKQNKEGKQFSQRSTQQRAPTNMLSISNNIYDTTHSGRQKLELPDNPKVHYKMFTLKCGTDIYGQKVQ